LLSGVRLRTGGTDRQRLDGRGEVVEARVRIAARESVGRMPRQVLMLFGETPALPTIVMNVCRKPWKSA